MRSEAAISSPDLKVEQADGVLVVTLNRPDSLNAVTPDMERAYFDLLAESDADPSIRAIVVTGAGRGFCAGADITVPTDDLAHGGPPLPERRPVAYPPTMITPVIAAINGACAGIGLAFALHADVRFVAEQAKLSTAFTRRGLIAEHGVSWHLLRLVGRGRASDLLISGRTFTGRDAADYGLAEFCLDTPDVLQAAIEYARDIAVNCSPRAIATVKGQLVSDDNSSVFDALLTADRHTRDSFTWPDLHEGIGSWQERRAPSFPAFPIH